MPFNTPFLESMRFLGTERETDKGKGRERGREGREKRYSHAGHAWPHVAPCAVS